MNENDLCFQFDELAMSLVWNYTTITIVFDYNSMSLFDNVTNSNTKSHAILFYKLRITFIIHLKVIHGEKKILHCFWNPPYYTPQIQNSL